MKKIIFSFWIMCISITLCAVPANDKPVSVVQPNGDTIMVTLRGDEYGAWCENSERQIIMQNDAGTWVYAQLVNGMMYPSNVVVSDKEPYHITKEEDLALRRVITMDIEKRKVMYQSFDNGGHTTFSEVSRVNVPDKAEVPLPTSGTAKILTILVQFSDVKFQDQANVRQYYDDLFNHSNLPTAACSATGESVNGFWRSASYGKFNLTSVVVGPYTAPKSQSYYGLKSSDTRDKELMKFAIDIAAKDIDMGQFDNNNDDWVEGVCIIYAGEGRDYVPYNNLDYIWPHKGFIEKMSRDGVNISKYCCSAELFIGSRRGIGTVCHELGHVMGAPDFYDIDSTETGGEFIGTADWDLMAGGSWNNNSKSPAHPNPWLKCYKWNWTSAQELSGTNRLYTLYPTEKRAGQIYRLSTMGLDFYLLENKQQDYINDDYSGNSKGLVIFHVGIPFAPSTDEVNVGHPQLLYVINPHSATTVPLDKEYGEKNVNRSFTNPSNPKPFFTSTTKPYNLGWGGNALPSPKDVTMIREETVSGERVVKFMLNPTINGDYKFCNHETFSISNLPDNATIDWGFVGDQGVEMYRCFNITPKSDNKAEYTRRSTLGWIDPSTGETHNGYCSGDHELTATVNVNGYSYKLPNKSVYLPEFEQTTFESLPFLGMWRDGMVRKFVVNNPIGDEQNIQWIVSGSAMHSTVTKVGKQVEITPDMPGSLNIRVVDQSGCSPYNETSQSFRVVGIISLVSPNPASGSAMISVRLTDNSDVRTGVASYSAMSSDGGVNEEYRGAYRLELWHKQYGMVRSMDVEEDTPTVQMNLSGLGAGDYILRLIVDGNLVNTQQLRVE